ncbi:MAG: hypothetical protein OXC94_04540 [Chloroflexi bacterium]|nr:hypothetical protein [Chloroflexota bacterium]
MTQQVVLTSLRELAGVRDLFADTGPVPGARALVPVIRGSGPEEIEALEQAARVALGEVEALLAADGERRREAEQGLGRLRAVRGEAARLRRIASELGEASRRAGALAESAFEPASKRRAESVATTAGRLVNQAEAHAAVLEREAAALAERGDIARVLVEEKAQEEEVRMREELELAGEHLDGGRTGEARRLLSSLEKKISSAPDLELTFATLRRREQQVKTRAAEEALREARRLHRREPARAIELIEEAELEGLPDELARHLYGCWLTACRRLDLLAAIHYRAGFGRGAVLIPAADGRWEVVSALGLRRWERGRRFAPQALRGARPLA